MFAHSFMIMMLVNIKRIRCRIIQLRSSKDRFGRIHSTIQIYDNAINNWISKIGDIEQRKQSQDIIRVGIRTKNPVFNQLVKDIEHVARHSTAPILLSGATGTGKTIMARRIYELRLQTGMVTGPLVEVNCASFRGDSAMSALFGHVRGAFTGATSERKGMLAMAHSGILFLDEVGELGPDVQALLLKAVEEKRFFPFGSDKPVFSNFQLITATNRDLFNDARNGSSAPTFLRASTCGISVCRAFGRGRKTSSRTSTTNSSGFRNSAAYLRTFFPRRVSSTSISPARRKPRGRATSARCRAVWSACTPTPFRAS